MVKCGDSTVLFLPVHWQADVNVETEDAICFYPELHMPIFGMLTVHWIFV